MNRGANLGHRKSSGDPHRGGLTWLLLLFKSGHPVLLSTQGAKSHIHPEESEGGSSHKKVCLSSLLTSCRHPQHPLNLLDFKLGNLGLFFSFPKNNILATIGINSILKNKGNNKQTKTNQTVQETSGSKIFFIPLNNVCGLIYK